MKVRHWPLLIAGFTTAAALTACGSSSTSPAPSTSASASPSLPATPSPSSTPSSGTTTDGGGSSSGDNAKLDLVVNGFNAKSGQLMSMFKGTYTAIKASPDYPNTLVLTYTFAKHIDPTTAGSALASQNDVLQAACTADFYKAMKAVGISTPHARFVYANPDGSNIASYTCK